jgi:hypothetical protein
LIPGLVLVVALLVFFFAGQSSFSFTANRFTGTDYRNIMGDSIQHDPRIVDIAMLGAHDAFAGMITRNKPSAGNPRLAKRAWRLFGLGYAARMTRAQKSDAYALAVHGVRYFDARIVWYQGAWYTLHDFISGPLEFYITGLLRFLKEAKKEVVIIDVQHAYTGDQGMEALLSYLFTGISYEGKSLRDYIGYDPAEVKLGDLRYRELTARGSQAVALAKAPVHKGSYHFQYENSIRSIWHRKCTDREMLAGIDGEYHTLLNDGTLARDGFRVNQAQKTGFAGKLPGVIFLWSLLDMADRFNPVLAGHRDFNAWLGVMPILMVDYADSMRDGFNDTVIAKINEFNAGSNAAALTDRSSPSAY